ncbi:MAG: 4a-hydroxytetrahydrobiopterin dehydratase [Phycisphaerales bacterium]|nr:4a-hydroxytetrahydrobiopterin dehydratase [Phycisphaerales bacterium]
MAAKLSPSEIATRLALIPHWSRTGELIERTFAFAHFVAAMQFVNLVAQDAERTQHHPDILIKYNRVTLAFSTHDAGGLTQKDFDAARIADELAGAHSA